jgi:hypothetical protein
MADQPSPRRPFWTLQGASVWVWILLAFTALLAFLRLLTRRRFQFRMRTLMIVVTLLAVACAYLAHEAKIVRERKAFLQSPGERVIQSPSYRNGQPVDPDMKVSWIRRMLGDGPVSMIALPMGTEKTECDRITALFPETKIMAYYPRLHPMFGSGTKDDWPFFPFAEVESPSRPATKP